MNTALTRRLVRGAASAAAVAVLGVGVAACGPDGGSDAAGQAQDGSNSSGSKDSGSDSNSNSGSGDSGSSAAPQGGGNGGSNSGGSPTSRCHTADLRLVDGSSGGPGDTNMDSDGQQVTHMYTLVNKSTRTCTMYGYPGVSITDGSKTSDLPRQTSEKPQTVTLKPNYMTTFKITLLTGKAGAGENVIQPKTVVVTPPNERTRLSTPWTSGGAIQDQSGATHPASYVAPVSGAQPVGNS